MNPYGGQNHNLYGNMSEMYPNGNVSHVYQGNAYPQQPPTSQYQGMRIIECNYVTPYDVQDQYRPSSGIQPPSFNWYDNNAYEADRTNTQGNRNDNMPWHSLCQMPGPNGPQVQGNNHGMASNAPPPPPQYVTIGSQQLMPAPPQTQVNNHGNGCGMVSNAPPPPPQYVSLGSQQRVQDPPQTQVNNHGNGFTTFSKAPPQFVSLGSQQHMPGPNGPQMQLVGPSQYQNHNVNSMPSHGPPRVSYNSGDYVSDEVFATIDLLELDRSIPMAAQTSRPHAGKNGQSNGPPPPSLFGVAGASAGAGQSISMECAICLEDINSQNISSTPCGHLFCEICITKAVQKNHRCPLCKKTVRLNTLRRIFLPIRN